MEERIENILIKGKHLLESFKQSDLLIEKIEIYHSTQIILKVTDKESEKVYQVICNQCKYFNGDVNSWAKTNLTLEYTNEILKFGERYRDNYLFELMDLNNNYFIKCKYLLFNEILNNLSAEENKEVGDIKNLTPQKIDVNIEKLNKSLQEKNHARIKIINSDKNLLNIRIDDETLENFLNFSKQTNEWYKADSKNILDLICYNPFFMNVNFESWEINEALRVYKEEDAIILADHNMQVIIKCSLIEVISSNKLNTEK